MNTSRRKFLAQTGLLVMGTSLDWSMPLKAEAAQKEPIIDIHQHIHYHARNVDDTLKHQLAMGVTTTILLPSGRPVNSASTHQGVANGLQAQCGGNAECFLVARENKHYEFGACAVPDAPDAIFDLEQYLKRGAVVIGELKFGVDCDGPEMQKIYQLAEAYNVPVLMHFQHGMYNYGFDRFYKILEKYPRVNFIGHAQTWWANIARNHPDQSVLYPKTTVEEGGLTDRYLSDYPNMYGDLSAGSGLNALLRDEEHAKYFLRKHQDKLLYGSDCEDVEGTVTSNKCSGAKAIAAIRQLSDSKKTERKILYENAKKLFRL